MKDILANLRYSIEVEHDDFHHAAQLEAIDKIPQLIEGEIQQAKEEVAREIQAGIIETYSGVRWLYDQPVWQAFWAKYIKG